MTDLIPGLKVPPPSPILRGQFSYSIDYHVNHKRVVTHRCCSRLAVSGLPGADLAVEYIYGKYIKNQSVHTIKHAGRVLFYFLHFLHRQETTIANLRRTDISAYVAREQGRGLATQSVMNHLRTVYVFVSFLVDHGVLPQT